MGMREPPTPRSPPGSAIRARLSGSAPEASRRPVVPFFRRARDDCGRTLAQGVRDEFLTAAIPASGEPWSHE